MSQSNQNIVENSILNSDAVPYKINIISNEIKGRGRPKQIREIKRLKLATLTLQVITSYGMCEDYKITINPYLNQKQYHLPKPKELFAALNNGQNF